jgi:UPF0148 protein
LSQSGRDKRRLAAELVSQGATMLAEPCPKCGGIQVRFRGRVFCTNHDDLAQVMSSEVLSIDTVAAQVREVLLQRVRGAASELATEKDTVRQEQLVSLMTRCFELLQKIPEK